MPDGKELKMAQYVSYGREDGCEKGAIADKEFTFAVPPIEPQGNGPLIPTTSTANYKVMYYVRCFM